MNTLEQINHLKNYTNKVMSNFGAQLEEEKAIVFYEGEKLTGVKELDPARIKAWIGLNGGVGWKVTDKENTDIFKLNKIEISFNYLQRIVNR